MLELKLPQLPPGYAEPEMAHALADRIPNLVAWIVSFVLVARIWVVHHAIVANLGRCGVDTFVWNFVLLGVCSLVPFGAALIGTYEWDPLAITIFASLFGLTGIALGLFARHAARATHLHHERTVPSSLLRQWRYYSVVLPIVAVISVALIFVAEILSLAIWVVEPFIAFAAERRRSAAEEAGKTAG